MARVARRDMVDLETNPLKSTLWYVRVPAKDMVGRKVRTRRDLLARDGKQVRIPAGTVCIILGKCKGLDVVPESTNDVAHMLNYVSPADLEPMEWGGVPGAWTPAEGAQ